jgi:hypothetical protein
MDRLEPIHFAGGVLDEYRHVCAFFDSADEEHAVMHAFVREGLELGQRAYHIVDPRLRPQYIRRLESAGIAVRAAIERGQFELVNWQEAYLREGRFDQSAMLDLVEQVLRSGRERGYSLTRLIAHMEWSLEDFPGVSDLVEYETRLNYVLPRYRDPVI